MCGEKGRIALNLAHDAKGDLTKKMAKEKFPGFEEILRRTFEQMGARPEPVFVPAVLIRKGEELKGIYVSPQKFGKIYCSEEEAGRDLGANDALYMVNVTRVR